MAKKHKFKKWRQNFAALIPISAIIISACTTDPNHVGNLKNELSLAVNQIGSQNYNIESPSLETLQLMIEPLVHIAAPGAIAPFLTNKNVSAFYYGAGDSSVNGVQHAIDFDVNKSYPDGYVFNPNNPYNPKAPTPDPTFAPGGDDYGDNPFKKLSGFDFGAADAIVTLTGEADLKANSNSTGNPTSNRVVRFHIRNGLKWSDGVQVTAADYVATARYMLDPRYASNNFNAIINSLKLFNAQKCFSERFNLGQANPSWSSLDTWNNAGACHYEKTMPNGLPSAGNLSFEKSFGVRDIGNNWVEYEFYQGQSGPINSIFNLLGNPLFLPSPAHFIEKLPRKILDFGLSTDRFLTNGAFKLEELAPEYILTAIKNPDYWDAEDVFADRLKLRIVLDPFVQTTLFADGEIAEISGIAPQLLPRLIANPNVQNFVKKGGDSGILTYIGFSAAGLAKDPETYAMASDPDFRRAIYYATNRIDVLKGDGTFGILPSGVNIPTGNFASANQPRDLPLYNYYENADFRPDLPGAESKKLAVSSFLDRTVNNYSDFWGEKIDDHDFRPEVAQGFFRRWIHEHPTASRTLKFQFNPSDEGKAIALKVNLEAVLGKEGFRLELEPVLYQSLVARIQIGDYTAAFNTYKGTDNGTSPFNWYFPFTTTAFSGTRVFANQTLYPGDTLSAYARRLAKSNPQRLRELGFDPTPFITTDAGNRYRLLLQLDQYLTLTEAEQLPNIAPNIDFKNTDTATWNHSSFLQKADPNESYIFKVGQGIGSNDSSFKFLGNLQINNPLIQRVGSDFGLSNPDLTYSFLVSLEKLLRDAAFDVPLSNYSSSYFATRIVAWSSANSVGFPRNLVHAYRGDIKLLNKNGLTLPDFRILGQN